MSSNKTGQTDEIAVKKTMVKKAAVSHASNKNVGKARKQIILGVVAFFVLAGLSFGFAYTLANNSSQPAATANTASASGESIGTKSNPHLVPLTKDNKKPIDVLLKTGEYVQFNSRDGGDHQIIQGIASNTNHGAASGHAASSLDSGVIKSDEGYLLQFNDVGKFEFHDRFFHDYTISIIVYDPNADNTIR